MTVTYQVGGGGHLDIDFWVRSVHTRMLFQSHFQLSYHLFLSNRKFSLLSLCAPDSSEIPTPVFSANKSANLPAKFR